MVDVSNISLDLLLKEKDRLEINLSELEKKLTLVKLMIDAYSKNENIDFNRLFKFESSISKIKPVPIDNFPFNKKWLDQILYLLNQKNRFLNNHELAVALVPYYPNFNIDKLKRKVSVTISAAYKNEKVDGLIKIKVNNLPKGNVWGYKKWLDANGGILKNYKPFGNSEY